MREQVHLAAALLAAADGLLIAAGAGMGVDSGLPDFRGDAGFWSAYPALGAARIPFIEVASPTTFARDSKLAWGFYGHRLDMYRRTQPHAGFGILRKWAARKPRGAFIFTSNVDGQFQKAGFDPDSIHECHGSIHWLQCLNGCTPDIWSADGLNVHVDAAKCQWQGPLPACPRCDSVFRPNLLMFGDGEWLSERYDHQQRRLQAWMQRVERPLVVEIGAGTYIPSVRYFSESMVRQGGASLIRINPREAEVPSPCGVGLVAGALEGLSWLDDALTALTR